MPNYSASGEENLRADAKVNANAAEGDKGAPGLGQDAGGDETGAKTLSNAGKSTPSGKGSTPSGVQTFEDEV